MAPGCRADRRGARACPGADRRRLRRPGTTWPLPILAAIERGAHLRRTYATPTGPRSSPSTTSSPASTRHHRRAERAVALASSTGPRWRWRWSTGWTWGGYHAYTPPAPTCYAGSPLGGCRAAYEKAIELAGNTAEVGVLARRRDQLGPRGLCQDGSSNLRAICSMAMRSSGEPVDEVASYRLDVAGAASECVQTLRGQHEEAPCRRSGRRAHQETACLHAGGVPGQPAA